MNTYAENMRFYCGLMADALIALDRALDCADSAVDWAAEGHTVKAVSMRRRAKAHYARAKAIATYAAHRKRLAQCGGLQ